MLMPVVRRIKNYLFGPQLYRVHASSDGTRRAYDYEPNSIEERSQNVLNACSVSKMLACYTSPLWVVFLYRRDYFTIETASGLMKLSGWAALMLMSVIFIRAIGRHKNQTYLDFIYDLEMSFRNPQDETRKRKMRTYDFDFQHWPVDFRWDDVEESKASTVQSSTWSRISRQHSSVLSSIFWGLPKEFLAYVMAHSFGIRLTYPGSVSLLQAAYGSALGSGRSKYVEQHDGIRAKLLSRDGNEIDTMFIDLRASHHPNRMAEDTGPVVPSRHCNTLVICCEGNAGFYEVGCMCTPLQAGYSVLGWNHPGFAGSTGKPFPEAENNAIDVVMQYAIHKLAFKPEDIIVFAWSIGGFSAIQASAAYPDIRGVVLDATFYDIMPFAKRLLPQSLDGIVTYTVRNYLDLHNDHNLKKYNGPVSFVRRMQDEVMNVDGQYDYESNLGNLLLENFLRHRFPALFEQKKEDDDAHGSDTQSRALWDWLKAIDEASRNDILTRWQVFDGECKRDLNFHMRRYGSSFPITVGEELSSTKKTQLVLYLAKQHMSHYTSTHCTPLPSSFFHAPWKIDSVLESADSGSDSSDFEVINRAS